MLENSPGNEYLKYSTKSFNIQTYASSPLYIYAKIGFF